jgi:hypothetical protein
MKPTYTTKMHVYRLKRMIANPRELKRKCPASEGFRSDFPYDHFWSNDPCEVCSKFVGIEPDTRIVNPMNPCPCYYFAAVVAKENGVYPEDVDGCERALEITLKKIKEYDDANS